MDKENFWSKRDRIDLTKKNQLSQSCKRSQKIIAKSNDDCLVCKSNNDQSEALQEPIQTDLTDIETRIAIAEVKSEKLNVQKAPSIDIVGDFAIQTVKIVDIQPENQVIKDDMDNIAVYEISHQLEQDAIVINDSSINANSKQVHHSNRRNIVKSASKKQATKCNYVFDEQQVQESTEDFNFSNKNEDIDERIENLSLNEPGILANVDTLLHQQRKFIKQVHTTTETFDKFLTMRQSTIESSFEKEDDEVQVALKDKIGHKNNRLTVKNKRDLINNDITNYANVTDTSRVIEETEENYDKKSTSNRKFEAINDTANSNEQISVGPPNSLPILNSSYDSVITNNFNKETNINIEADVDIEDSKSVEGSESSKNSVISESSDVFSTCSNVSSSSSDIFEGTESKPDHQSVKKQMDAQKTEVSDKKMNEKYSGESKNLEILKESNLNANEDKSKKNDVHEDLKNSLDKEESIDTDNLIDNVLQDFTKTNVSSSDAEIVQENSVSVQRTYQIPEKSKDIETSNDKTDVNSQSLQEHLQKSSLSLESSFEESVNSVESDSQDSLKLFHVSHFDKKIDKVEVTEPSANDQCSVNEDSTESKIESKLSQARDSLNTLMKTMDEKDINTNNVNNETVDKATNETGANLNDTSISISRLSNRLHDFPIYKNIFENSKRTPRLLLLDNTEMVSQENR